MATSSEAHAPELPRYLGRARRLISCVLITIAIGVTVGLAAAATAPPKRLTSNGDSYAVAVSADGRYVAFTSGATDLVPDDTNKAHDVFVRDLRRGVTTRVSVGLHGRQPRDHSFGCGMSRDGRFVAFASDDGSFVPHDTNRAADIFVRDMRSGRVERVSVSSAGAQENGLGSAPGCALSGDGRLVAFQSYASNLVGGDTNDTGDVFVHDRATGATERVSVDSLGKEGNGNSGYPEVVLSADGRYVAFTSEASNLVQGDHDDARDIFVHDRALGTTVEVPGTGGARLDALSGDGRYVLFDSQTSLAGSKVDRVFLWDASTGATELESGSNSSGAAVSLDGRFVLFSSFTSGIVAGDRNGAPDAFVRDRATGTTALVSVRPGGGAIRAGGAAGALSSNGRFVVFRANLACRAWGAVCPAQLYLHDLQSGTVRLITPAVRGTPTR